MTLLASLLLLIGRFLNGFAAEAKFSSTDYLLCRRLYVVTFLKNGLDGFDTILDISTDLILTEFGGEEQSVFKLLILLRLHIKIVKKQEQKLVKVSDSTKDH